MTADLKSRKGSSLLEVLLASVIFSMGLLGIIGMFSTGETGRERGAALTSAVLATQEKMEEKWGAARTDLLWDDLDGDGLPETPMKPSAFGAYVGKDRLDTGIERKWTVITDPEPQGLIRIQVSSTWTDRYGRKRSFELRGIRQR